MGQKRKHHSAKEKVEILRRHLVDKVPISKLCDEYGVQPSFFYGWQKLFFEHGTSAFERRGEGSSAENALKKKVVALEEKLTRKNEVVAELMEEHVKLKKELGEP